MTRTEYAGPTREARPDSFEHWGLLYRDAPHYVAAVAAFVRSAVRADQPVLVAVPRPNLDLIRDELSDLNGQVRFADMAVQGRNPRRIIATVLLAFAAAHGGRRVAIVGEPIWAERTPVEYPAWRTRL